MQQVQDRKCVFICLELVPGRKIFLIPGNWNVDISSSIKPISNDSLFLIYVKGAFIVSKSKYLTLAFT